MHMHEYIGSLLIILQLLFANSGGLGGGGMVISSAMIFYAFDAKNAIALSNMSIFLAVLLRWIVNMNEKHPDKPKATLIDFSYSVLMLPMMIVGTALGVFANVMLPEVIIITALVIVLAYMFFTTAMKVKRVWVAE